MRGAEFTRLDMLVRLFEICCDLSELLFPTTLIIIPSMSIKERLVPPIRSSRILVFMLRKILVGLFGL